MPRIALVTYAAAPDLTPDDRLLRAALVDAGAEVHAVTWTDDHPWADFDLVVVRSTWDYFLRPDEFAAWIDRLEESGAAVLNPLPVIRWNGDKRYLLELENRGVRIVPTAFIEPGDEAAQPLATVLESRGWTDAVVKPSISGGAHLTWRTFSQAADEVRYRELIRGRNGGVLVQPFLPEVLTDGELSLIFLDGVFSHAAVKRPKPGDFRVQQEHGGLYAPARPAAGIIEQAKAVIAAAAALTGVAPASLAYARVDGIVRHQDGRDELMLMELECIEPSLFFRQHPAAAGQMAGSLLARARSRVESRAGA